MDKTGTQDNRRQKYMLLLLLLLLFYKNRPEQEQDRTRQDKTITPMPLAGCNNLMNIITFTWHCLACRSVIMYIPHCFCFCSPWLFLSCLVLYFVSFCLLFSCSVVFFLLTDCSHYYYYYYYYDINIIMILSTTTTTIIYSRKVSKVTGCSAVPNTEAAFPLWTATSLL